MRFVEIKNEAQLDMQTLLRARDTVLLGISKRGNKYLRRLFIHGARAAL